MNPIRNAADDERRVERVMLRLVKGGPERRAIEAGQADAILDPTSGKAFLLPEAQQWLMNRVHTRQESAVSAAFDGLPIEIGVLDADGIVLSVNRAWRDASGAGECLGAGIARGGNYLAACDSARGNDRLDGFALAAGIRQVIAGERTLFRYEHSCDPATGRRWFLFNVAPATGDRAARAIVSREDISERRRGELLLGLEYTVARCLAESADAGAGLRAVIRAVCETLGWDCGRYFRLDPAGSVLRFQESWGMPAPAIQQFLAKSRNVALRVGAGLKGRVYRSGQPLWVVADTPDGVASTALAPESDGDGMFIFPVTSDYRANGVLAFSGRTIREPDDRMLQTVRAIGSQLGAFLQRQQTLDTLRRDEARFRRLTELSTDWYWELDRDFRYTQYVGAGVVGAEEALGKTPWDLPNVVVASADWVAHRAQLGERWSFCDFEFSTIRADGPGYYSISGEPVFDAAGAFTGYWGTGMDLTRRTRAELALRESEAQLRATPGDPTP